MRLHSSELRCVLAACVIAAPAGIAHVVRGHGGDIATPGLRRMAFAVIMLGGGAGAGTSAWLMSRPDHQTSSIGWDIGAATMATAIAFRVSGWPLERGEPTPRMSRFRRLAPVWMAPLAATIAASATRRRQ